MLSPCIGIIALKGKNYFDVNLSFLVFLVATKEKTKYVIDRTGHQTASVDRKYNINNHSTCMYMNVSMIVKIHLEMFKFYLCPI